MGGVGIDFVLYWSWVLGPKGEAWFWVPTKATAFDQSLTYVFSKQQFTGSNDEAYIVLSN